MPKDKHWQAVRAKVRVMRDLIRQQQAPVAESEASQLYHEIKAEVAKLGLPESDAAWFYKKMQRDQWKFQGIPIEDWRFTVASFHQHNFFPSMR